MPSCRQVFATPDTDPFEQAMGLKRWARHALISLAMATALGVSGSARAAECADLWNWVNKACRTLVDTHQNGRNELVLSGYSWHTPWTWDADKRAEKTEESWGAGWARTVEHENGDTDSVYALVFRDSHAKPQYNRGYMWFTFWGSRDNVQPGLGYSAFMFARSDIANGWPLPAVLPLFSLRYDRFMLLGTYIPALGQGINNGSVFYFFGKITLD